METVYIQYTVSSF